MRDTFEVCIECNLCFLLSLHTIGLAADRLEPQVASTAPMAFVDGALPLIGLGQMVLAPTDCMWACIQISMLESDQKHRDIGNAAGGVISTIGPVLANANPVGALALPLAKVFAEILARNPDDVMLSTIWSGFQDQRFGVSDDALFRLYQVKNRRAELTIRIGIHE